MAGQTKWWCTKAARLLIKNVHVTLTNKPGLGIELNKGVGDERPALTQPFGTNGAGETG
jgi:hypothetical protein